jgi:hypothetical protein
LQELKNKFKQQKYNEQNAILAHDDGFSDDEVTILAPKRPPNLDELLER